MSSRKDKILIFGRVPPPFGGVTVHIKRLITNLNELNYQVKLFAKMTDIFFYSIWHLHTNNPFKRLIISLIGFTLRKKIILTLHRNYKRDKGFKLFLTQLNFSLVDKILLLNEDSYKYYNKIFKSKAILSSSFIKPTEEEKQEHPIKSDDLETIKEFKTKGKVYCTCAHHLRYDDNDEIYGILEILDIFNERKDIFLVFSDPSSEYSELLRSKKIHYGSNIKIINYQHSFLNVLDNSDIYIRNTTTDGDSLSIHESLGMGKKVLCSNVVSRPSGVIEYNLGDLRNIIDLSVEPNSTTKQIDTIKQILEIYEN